MKNIILAFFIITTTIFSQTDSVKPIYELKQSI